MAVFEGLAASILLNIQVLLEQRPGELTAMPVQKRERGHLRWPLVLSRPLLGFSDPEHLGPALGASATRSGPLVLESDILRVLDFHLGPALHAICLCHSFLASSFIGFEQRLAHS